jgi:hypothetical protein
VRRQEREHEKLVKGQEKHIKRPTTHRINGCFGHHWQKDAGSKLSVRDRWQCLAYRAIIDERFNQRVGTHKTFQLTISTVFSRFLSYRRRFAFSEVISFSSLFVSLLWVSLLISNSFHSRLVFFLRGGVGLFDLFLSLLMSASLVPPPPLMLVVVVSGVGR